MTNPTPKTFTGRSRDRKTRRSVLVTDRLARFLISVGGIGTIIAVLGVCAFLVWVAVPLFLPASVDDLHTLEGQNGSAMLHMGVDEYQNLGWILRDDGSVQVFRMDTGELRATQQVLEPGQLSSVSFLIRGEMAFLGRTDGYLQMATIGFAPDILSADSVPAESIAALDQDDIDLVNYEDGVLEKTPAGQYRFQRLDIELGREVFLGRGPIHRLHHVIGPNGPLVAALVQSPGGEPIPEADDDTVSEDEGSSAEDSDDTPALAGIDEDPAATYALDEGLGLFLITGEERSNFLTGATTLELSEPQALPFDRTLAELPDHLALAAAGDNLYTVWNDGKIERFNITRPSESFVAQSSQLLESGRDLTSLAFALGNNTLLWGDSAGDITAGFPVPRDGFQGEELGEVSATTQDDKVFVPAKELRGGNSTAATAIASSARSRLVLTGYENGEIKLFNVTHASQLMSLKLPEAEPIRALVMAPKEDGLLVATPTKLYAGYLDPRHPEASVTALFRPVWYEGYSEPQHTWQSSSASDDFEAKLGLMPLIFGTLKATFYSMLFGAPLALLAAIFTSEFLHPRAKSVIKPGIELMASLPSVVLGFLAALVFAPVIEYAVPGTLATFFTLPLAFLVGAFLWQLLPMDVSIRFQNWRFGFMALMAPIGLLLGLWFGPVAEKIFFSGDMKAWLAWDPGDDRAALFGSATGGWMLLTLPLSILLVMFLVSKYINPIMRQRSAQWDRRRFALMDLGKLAVALVAVFASSLAMAALLNALGLDPRGGFVDTYMQRNAMVVGFVMGFAIIPIIYTISEDALSTVPEHLRSASLGAGATTWQTATRIVIPTAMSGLFSALMVGLGRAVGETMIVLMAAGNTPVMEWNIFNGFRTLSANIAVELPEAVRDSTHYRTLFLAALVLFVLTFIVNTVAEVIRQRFRKRAYQL